MRNAAVRRDELWTRCRLHARRSVAIQPSQRRLPTQALQHERRLPSRDVLHQRRVQRAGRDVRRRNAASLSLWAKPERMEKCYSGGRQA